MNLYHIYDARDARLFERTEKFIEAKTGRDALDKYLAEIGFKGKVKRSGDNFVQFRVTRAVEENGKHYTAGNSIWYAVIG